MAFEQYIGDVTYKNRKREFEDFRSIDETYSSDYRHYDQIQIRYFFPNGYGASMIHGLASYDLEIAVITHENGKNVELCYTTPVTNDVIGYIENQEEMESILRSIFELENRHGI